MADLKITIDGAPPIHTRDRVVAVEAFTTSLCKSVGEDPADAMFVLLVSAMNIARANATAGTDIRASFIGVINDVLAASETMFGGKAERPH